MTRANRSNDVVIVGGGVGGLACAIDLAASGVGVTVLERGAGLGGKLRVVRPGGVDVDAGPTVLTMRWVFAELFALAGHALDDVVPMARASILARHGWHDGARLDLFADRAETKDAIATAFGAAEGRGYERFCLYTQRIFETVEQPFLRAQRPTLTGLLKQVGSIGIGALARIDAHRTMARSLRDFFKDPRLLQLFGRYATYCGSSPYAMPATFNLIAHVEALGVHHVQGGMHRLRTALVEAATALGVTFRLGAEVTRIVVRGGHAAGVALASGEVLEAGAVVCNTDVGALASGLLGAEVSRGFGVTSPKERSLSAFTMAAVGRPSGFPLDYHNVFFSRDYAREFRELTGERRFPDDPTVYVCAQDRGEGAPPPGEERFFVIANAPPTGDDGSAWSEAEVDRCESQVVSSMSRCGLSLTVRERIRTTPRDFARLFPATGGALYGPAAHGPLAFLARASARTKTPRLYVAGGSVHPGPGVPMAALSGRLAAAALREDLHSTGRSRAAATSGIISTA
jgi:1-hydroxycarotenoid 3,4-desaturase